MTFEEYEQGYYSGDSEDNSGLLRTQRHTQWWNYWWSLRLRCTGWTAAEDYKG